jgi:hypothetical protein
LSAFSTLMGRWRSARGDQHVVFVWRPERDGKPDEWSASGISTTGAGPHDGRSGEEAFRALVEAAEEEARR